MSKALRAWLLEWPIHPLALAHCEMIEVIEQPEIYRVPMGPAWCRALVYWRQQLIALATPETLSLESLSIVAVAYQLAPRTPLQYAALPVHGLPRQIDVPIDADCELATDALDEMQVRACFHYEGRPVVVPDLAALFAPNDCRPREAVAA